MISDCEASELLYMENILYEDYARVEMSFSYDKGIQICREDVKGNPHVIHDPLGYSVCDFIEMDNKYFLNLTHDFNVLEKLCSFFKLELVRDNFVQINTTKDKNDLSYYNFHTSLSRFFKACEINPHLMNIDSFDMFLECYHYHIRFTTYREYMYSDKAKNMLDKYDLERHDHSMRADAFSALATLESQCMFMMTNPNEFSLNEWFVCSVLRMKHRTKNISDDFESVLIEPMCFITISNILKNKGTFKKCEHCNKWFVPHTKSDEKYCIRQSPFIKGKTCADAVIYFKNKEHLDDECNRLLKNIRQMYHNREDGTGLEKFNAEARDWRSKIKVGVKNKDEFALWLKSCYKRKYK